ncbi:LIMKAIN B LKAP [Salix purpurea]|uniref:LIMKAIN B LKAP n=1 Tax=Salix purpurea TaxID=77065 RepID=A0A9Q0V963_SALPP|nr:LIMKAIN B LKAP [Salix purpurea]
MIISEKKWVEECPSEAFPFKLTPFTAQSIVGDSPASNGLSSMFLSSTLESNLQRQPGHEGGKKTQNIFQTGVSSPVSDEKPSARSRSEILGDCQKLVGEILKEFPGGYNMGSFRKLFLERYGYELNAKKLGYPKLAFLLQIMPGVDIESNYIIPSNEMAMRSSAGRTVLNNTCPRSASSDSELSDASKKDEESDSTWEELGPADNSISGKKANESVSRIKGKR